MAKTGKITITEVSQNTTKKTTTINVIAEITTSGESYRGNDNTGVLYLSQDGKCILPDWFATTSGWSLKKDTNGNKLYATFTQGAPANTTTRICNFNVDVEHKSDGSSGNIAASFNYDDGWCTASTSATLNPIYTISYNANGGTGAPASHSYAYSTSGVTYLSSAIPKREGYEFLGWSLSATATSPTYRAGQAWNLNNKGNYLLYAVWKEAANVHVNIDGAYKHGKCLVDGNQCVVWKNINGKWYKSIT